MTHDIDAIYDNGILRPLGPLSLPDGARVHLRVEESNGGHDSTTNYTRWLDSVSGRWQGDFARGDEGNLEMRERLS